MSKKNTKLSTRAGPTKRQHGAKLMTIHPTIAEKWIEKLGRNRKVIPTHLRRLEKVLQDGEFVVTGETIKFDKDGNLIDGQHRLMACRNTGIPIESWVVFGLEPEVFDKLDQGKMRTAAHVLSIEDVKDSRTVAATVVAIRGIEIAIKSGNMPGGAGWTLKERLEPYDVRQFALDNRDLLEESVAAIRNHADARALLKPPSTFGALYFLLAKKNYQRTVEFFELLSSGTGLDNKSPILKLRQTLIGCLTDKLNRRSAPWKAAVTIKVWNAWLAGEEMKTIRFRTNDERFPKPRMRSK